MPASIYATCRGCIKLYHQCILQMILHLFLFLCSSRYLKDKPAPRTKDPRNYWLVHKTTHPHLYKIAVQYVSTPASSVACERFFSKTNSLFLNSWIKTSKQKCRTTTNISHKHIFFRVHSVPQGSPSFPLDSAEFESFLNMCYITVMFSYWKSGKGMMQIYGCSYYHYRHECFPINRKRTSQKPSFVSPKHWRNTCHLPSQQKSVITLNHVTSNK